MKRYTCGIVVAGLGLFAFAACDRSPPADPPPPPPATVETKPNVELVGESPVVRARVSSLRERFTVKELARNDGPGPSTTTFTRPLLRAGSASTFVAGDREVHAVFSAAQRLAVTRAANTLLPRTAAGTTEVHDESSNKRVRFALRGVNDVTVAVADGVALYPGALPEGDVAHRVHPEGTEDYAIFERKPAREELNYDVDVSEAAGLRLVSNQLELLDEGGTPFLRVAPPFVVDRDGERHDAKLAVTGCAYDQSPLAPWDRPVTKPGATSCQVSVTWHDVSYPAVVDPEWTATGSMAAARGFGHHANLLTSGLVLVTGSNGMVAELYNSAGTGTFAATGNMRVSRSDHLAVTLASGKVLLANGSGATPSAEIYDPATGTFSDTGAPGTNAERAVGAKLANGKVLIAGGRMQTGCCSSSPTANAYLYDPAAGTWANVGPMKSARTDTTATYLPAVDKILLVGGDDASFNDLASAELFDGATSTFALTGSMPNKHIRHMAAIMPASRIFTIPPPPPSNRVLIAGGIDGGSNQLITYIYSTSSSAFTTGPNLTYNRQGIFGCATPNGGQIFLSGGQANPAGQTTDVLSQPLIGGATIAILGSPPTSGVFKTPRGSAEMIALPSGQLLAIGGVGIPTSYLASAERFWVAYGDTCVQNSDCFSGECLDNRCCSGSCSTTDACMTCAPGTGACVAVTNAQDPDTCTGTNSCDATGVCKLANGQTCAAATDCASGNCIDKVCCDTACSGNCDSCNLPGKVGKCSIAPLGNPGTPACPTYACDGVSASCGTGCNSDSGCAANAYCAPNGTCQPRKAIAATCDPTANCKSPPCRECASGFCADGVCCDKACDGACDACTAALKTSGDDGTCGPQKEGATPVHGTCTADDPLTCKRDGKCTASGGCRLYYPPGQKCGASTCTGNAVTGFSCDGTGTCADNQAGVECAPFKCSLGSCTTACTTGDDCSSDAWCNAGLCEKKRANGKACPSKDACDSNICADGFCCNSPCTGQCEACDVKDSEGACTPITDKPHGSRTACASGSDTTPCTASSCDGTTRNTCAGFVGPTVTCGAASCTDGKATPAGTCSNGSCQVAPAVPCGAYACGATECKTTCAANTDCATGNICDPATKKCISGATCDGDHTTIDVSGAKTDCAPYKCESNGTCKPKCVSVDDCVTPNACDPASGKCVPPPGGDDAQDGCSTTSAPSSNSASLGLFALLALVAVRRRKEARRAS